MINPSKVQLNHLKNIETKLRNFYKKNNVEVSDLELNKLINNLNQIK